MNSNQPVVVGIGELLWDLLPDGKQLGGAPANFAYHAHALGAKVHLISVVGNDALGQEALKRLRAVGLDTSLVGLDSRHTTGTVGVELAEGGQPRFTIHEDVAWDHLRLDPLARGIAPLADAVCFGSLGQRCEPARRAIREFLTLTRADCLRVFDVNLRPPHFTREIVLESLALATALKFNAEELAPLARFLEVNAAEAAVFDALWRRFPLRLVALTRGAEGATLLTRDQRVEVPAVPPSVLVDTVGAGDAFTAAMVLGWLRRLPLREIGEDAVRLASFVCSRKGAMPDMTAFLATSGLASLRVDGPQRR